MFNATKKGLQFGLFVAFIIQLRRSIEKIEHPTSITAVTYSSDHNVTLPSFTICRVALSHDEIFDEVNDLNTLDPISLIARRRNNSSYPEKFMTLGSFDSYFGEDFVKKLYFSTGPQTNYMKHNLKDPEEAKKAGYDHKNLWSSFYTIWASMIELTKCQIFNYNVPMKPNPYAMIRMRLNLTEELGAYIKIHESDQTVTIFDRHLGSFVGAMQKSRTTQRIRIAQTEVVNLNWKDNQCNEKNDFSFGQCINNYFEKDMGCVYPWTNETHKSGRRVCGDSDTKSMALTGLFLSMANMNEIKSQTGCIPNCKYSKYEMHYMSDVMEPNSKKEQENMTDILFFMTDSYLKVETEVASYDWNSFIADVGGFLGLLLGLSLPDIYDKFVIHSQILRKHLFA